MSGAEEAGGGGPAAGPAGAVPAGAGAGVGVGAGPGAAAGPAAAAALGEAAGPGLPDEAGLAGARQLQEAAGDPDAPPKKRLRAAEAAEAAAAAAAAGSGKLEERLYSVLCCTVCLDLPKASVYQEPYWPCVGRVPGRGPVPPEQWPWLPLRTCRPFCSGSPRGGLVRACARPAADARLKEEQATCPNCRCEISKSLCCRNLAVEKAVSELPSECGFCLRQFPRSLLERHQKEECQDRVTQCKYKRIGCPWHGPFHELTVHEAACAHPTKTGNELMEILDEMDQSHRKEMQLYNSIFSLLSFEKIGYTEVQFRPYRTDDFITRLYYETPRFTVLNQTWVLKARVNDSERNPNLSCKRTLSFQLLLKSKVTAPLECSFLLLKGPYDDVKISPVIYHFVFTNESNETDYVPLPIVDSVECNKLLAAKNINLRLFLFQIQK
ncbi:zinc finger TRAF-type-containing protein 1 isoform X4 [Mustela lutreola]|uniref:zinc finger TRAF-type-containing protein 1 isoform X4 n=1 Tax=Mustela lutreola TaxID=9666 RepID=UPI0027973F47|nr:zinc finger TRAF-type-containing protein 1 isoform X4 [Mustela lutreola]